MADIELIPADYTRARALRQRLLRAALAIAVLVAAAVGARSWLAWRMAAERPLVKQLAAREATVLQQGQRLVALRAEKAAAVVRLEGLRTLQDGGAWLGLALAIDRAWTPKVWLAGMAQQRELHFAAPAAAPAGVPPGAKVAEPPQPQVRNRFEIEGHGMDHSAVTEFMRAVASQPGLASVRLEETGLRRMGTIDVVDFRLSGVISAASGSASAAAPADAASAVAP